MTAQIRFGLPILADDRAHAILRDAWLCTAWRARWFVGPYRVWADRVSLLACPGRSSASAEAWVAAWKTAAAVRINQLTGGHGPLWEPDVPRELVTTVSAYEAHCAALWDSSAGFNTFGALGPGHVGLLWQLLPAGCVLQSRCPPGAAPARSQVGPRPAFSRPSDS